MNRSYSKIRHMQQSNLMLENRMFVEKSRQFLMEIEDDGGLLIAYPDLKTTLKPKLDAADKNGETSVGVYGTKAYFRAVKGNENWTIYVYTFGRRAYGYGYDIMEALDFPDTAMNEVPSFLYGNKSTQTGKIFFANGSDAQSINTGGSLKLTAKYEIKTDVNIAADISKNFTGFDAAKLVTIANNLKLGWVAKNAPKGVKAKLTGVAKTLYDSLSPSQN